MNILQAFRDGRRPMSRGAKHVAWLWIGILVVASGIYWWGQKAAMVMLGASLLMFLVSLSMIVYDRANRR